MTRFVAVAACLMCLAGAFKSTAQRQAIYVNGKLKNGSDAQIADALSRCVDRYRNTTTQIDFLKKDEKTAAFAYLQFTVDKEATSNIISMVMTSNVRIVSAQRPIQSDCNVCGPQPVRKLFHEVIEQTLFSGARALYRPLSIKSCREAEDNSVVVTVERTKNGIGLEHGIHYGLRRVPATNELGLILVRDATATGDLTSTFKITAGATKPRGSFIRACNAGTAQAYMLVPHGRLPSDNTKVNKDVPSATK